MWYQIKGERRSIFIKAEGSVVLSGVFFKMNFGSAPKRKMWQQRK